MVSHNNDRKYYRIAIDTAKEGDEIFNLTEYFKGRVGDRNAPLLVTFYQQGSLMNVKGLKPFIQGNVGHYSFDEDGKIVMADDAAVVSYTGTTNDTDYAGHVTYIFPEQMFPQEGIFYGSIGLVDDETGQKVTSVDVWFKVLAGVAYLGKAKNYYIGEIDQIITTAQEKIRTIVNSLNQSASDALTKAQSDFDGKKAELEDEVQAVTKQLRDEVDQLNAQGSTTNSMMETVKAALTELQTKIQEDGLFTKADAQKFEDSLNQAFQKMIDEANEKISNTQIRDEAEKFVLDPQNQFLEAMPAYLQDTFDHATTVPHGDNIVNIALITDNHHQEDKHPWSKKAYSGKSMEHYQWFANGTLASRADVAIADGDNINGDTYRPTLVWETIHSWAMLYSRFVRTALFMIMGNHDTGVGQTPGLDPSKAMTEDDMKNAYHTKTPLFGEVRDQDSLYFYKDLPDKKVRVIGLNSSDLPWTLDDKGMYKHNRLEEAAFGEAQLNWLANSALKLPDNSWQVIFFFHHPLSSNNLVNRQAFMNIVTAFKNGTAITVNANEADDIQINNLQVDFTQQGKGTVIGCFSGHYHRDEDDLSILNGTPCVVTDADLSSSLPKEIVRRNSVNEFCWDTISINTETRKIHCYRFGRGKDREYNY